MKKLFASLLLASTSLVALAHDAHATLGGDVASIVTNTKTFAATRQVQSLATGERHELTLSSGIVVREYVAPSGAVYAVTWRGARMPDLRELLGPYFSQLSSTASRRGHHHVSLRGADFVVQSSGRRGSFSGRAWVPSLVPAGVKLDAVLQ